MLTRHYHFPADELWEQQRQNKPIIFLDIETTGLQRDTTILYLIGCGYFEQKEYHIIQWFNDDAISEPAMLLSFQDFAIRHPGPLLTFNGENFDIPYLNRHYELNGIPCRLDASDSSKSLDMYKLLKPFQHLFGMPHGRQKDWEHFLNIHREDRYNGGQLIGIYKEYLRKKDDVLLDTLLLHNMEDIRGMERLLPLLSYPAMMEGHFTFQKICANSSSFPSEQSIVVSCRLENILPVPLHIPAVYLQANDSKATSSRPADAGAAGSNLIAIAGVLDAKEDMLYLTIPVMDGSLKYFYPDYRNYYYLPEEDRAIHKSVGCYVDKNHRIAATASTCYIRKSGLFLPVVFQKNYKGVAMHGEKYQNILTFYKINHKDKVSYIEAEELFHGHPDMITPYLSDWMKGILMAAIRQSVPICDYSERQY